MANQFLALALFIILLSFFIILNSMASYDEDKARPVLQSLSIAFSTREIEENIAQSTITEEEKSIYQGSEIDRIKALFSTNISGFKSQENRFGNELYAQVPLKEFEAAMQNFQQRYNNTHSGVQGAADKFIPLLVSILKSENGQQPYHMDIILNIENNPAKLKNKDPETLRMLIKKTTIFSDILETVGLPKKLMSAGLEKGDVDYVTLAFTPYVPYVPVSSQSQGNQE